MPIIRPATHLTHPGSGKMPAATVEKHMTSGKVVMSAMEKKKKKTFYDVANACKKARAGEEEA